MRGAADDRQEVGRPFEPRGSRYRNPTDLTVERAADADPRFVV
ncbi:hypothetical protein [Haloplanus salinus]|nr:hypothetical protein [Haloplanus salinus]